MPRGAGHRVSGGAGLNCSALRSFISDAFEARHAELLAEDPPVGNANTAWLQHIHWHLAPFGTAGVVLANGSMSSNQSGEGEIRKAMVEADAEDDGEPFTDKMQRLSAQWREQQQEAARLDAAIEANLKTLGF